MRETGVSQEKEALIAINALYLVPARNALLRVTADGEILASLQAREDLTRRAPAPLQHAAVLPRSSRASAARIPFPQEGRTDLQACAVV